MILSNKLLSTVVIIYLLFSAGDDVASIDHYPIRLMDGTTPYEGRVEILYKGVWGTVCRGSVFANWGYPESHVVCRQMGFGPALTGKPELCSIKFSFC